MNTLGLKGLGDELGEIKELSLVVESLIRRVYCNDTPSKNGKV